MMRSLFSAVSGLKSHQTAMDVIGNNVANVNTTGYKGSRVVFQDIFSQTISSATAATDTTGGINGKQIGLGVGMSTIGMNMTEGSTQSTSRPLDFAISGEGYFVVQSGGGVCYTRNGALELDNKGFLVTGNGDFVLGVKADDPTAPGNLENDTVPLPEDLEKIQINGTLEDLSDTYSEYAIDANGVMTAVNSLGETVTLGRMVIATFNNTAGLEKTGTSYYQDSSNSGMASFAFANDNCGKLESGSLEMSNVDLATELTNMIIMQRGFQSNSRVITTSDSMLEELVNLKR